jgi:hypothetical protein
VTQVSSLSIEATFQNYGETWSVFWLINKIICWQKIAVYFSNSQIKVITMASRSDTYWKVDWRMGIFWLAISLHLFIAFRLETSTDRSNFQQITW